MECHAQQSEINKGNSNKIHGNENIVQVDLINFKRNLREVKLNYKGIAKYFLLLPINVIHKIKYIRPVRKYIDIPQK